MERTLSAAAVFEDVVLAFLEDVAGVAFPGQKTAFALAKHGSRALFRVLSRYTLARQTTVMDDLAAMDFGQARDIAERVLDRTALSPQKREEFASYLAAIPMTSRQALKRSGDDGHVTTLVSQLPRSADEMARFVPIRPPRFEPGFKLPGHDFRLNCLLGMGGFAEVWKAYPTEFNRETPVALKFCFDTALMASLRTEIRVLDMVGAHDPDKDFVNLKQTNFTADPPFLVFEYMAGGNLANWIEGFGGARPTPDDVVAVLKMAARAMQVAHAQGIVHRDLKPSNLMLTGAGRVKVTDFGIGHMIAEAEHAEPRAGVTGISESALFHGAFTPMYTDPMRLPGADPSPQDDVYALGVVGFQLLMGDVRCRMQGNWQSYLRRCEVPDALITVVETCTAPPSERYAEAGAMLAALEALSRPGRGPGPASPEPPEAPDPPPAVGYCTRCGAQLGRVQRFCTACGAPRARTARQAH